MPSQPARKIVEDVLGPARTRKLWTANYDPVLGFTPQTFEIGTLLPAMLFMARFGKRRGTGKFAKTFARGQTGTRATASVADVTAGIVQPDNSDFVGFADALGQSMLGDLLLSWCLENRNHAEGQTEPVQRILPTHYFASWVDLPDNIGHLRGVPELLTALLARQIDGDLLRPNTDGPFPVGATDLDRNPLLKLFRRHCAPQGPDVANQAADRFAEADAADLGIDELLAVRIALALGHAPDPARGDRDIANRWPLARRAGEGLADDLGIFIAVCAPDIPRQTFLRMLEAGIGLGMLNLLLSTATILDHWQRTGDVLAPEEQTPIPLFVDASQGQNLALRETAEAAMTDCMRRLEQLPVQLMMLRLLDDAVHTDRVLSGQLPPDSPDPTRYIQLLGDVYQDRHPRSAPILDRLFDYAQQLGEALEDGSPQVALQMRNTTLLDIAHGLCTLMGPKIQSVQFQRALESALMSDKPNGLAVRRRISRTESGQRRSHDVRAIVLSSAALDFLVHRHLYADLGGQPAGTLTLHRFLDLLRDRYGLYIDEEPPGQSLPRELLMENKAWFERRLRDLGLLIGVNDAEAMKQLRPRYQRSSDHAD